MKRWAAICRFGGIGDNLIAASVARPLKRQGYMVEVITSDSNSAVYLNNPNIDKLAIKNVARDMPKDQKEWQFYLASRANEYDVFCHLSHTCEARHAVFQHMTEWWWPDDYRRKICAGSYLETVHDIAGVPYDFGPLYYVTDEEKDRALETKHRLMGDKKCVTWILSGSRIDKVYPYCAFAVARLIRETGAHVVMMGNSAQEFAMAETIQKTVKITNGSVEGLHLALSPQTSEPGGTYNWPIRRSLGFAICASDVVITPDTGPAWATAMYSMPKIVLISHTSVENVTKHWVNTTTLHADQNRVPCWPCHKLHDAKDTCVQNAEGNGAACISDISVETIIQLVKQKLAQQNNVIHAEGMFVS
jgi:ADP-heptose:LPS heptosyltransferase